MTSCVLYMKIRWSFAVGVSVPQTAENFQRISVIFTKKEGRRAKKEVRPPGEEGGKDHLSKTGGTCYTTLYAEKEVVSCGTDPAQR